VMGEMVDARPNAFVYLKASGKNNPAGRPIIMGLHPRVTWKFVDMNSAKEMGVPADDPGQALFDAAFAGL
jgi:hypothetical protein